MSTIVLGKYRRLRANLVALSNVLREIRITLLFAGEGIWSGTEIKYPVASVGTGPLYFVIVTSPLGSQV